MLSPTETNSKKPDTSDVFPLPIPEECRQNIFFQNSLIPSIEQRLSSPCPFRGPQSLYGFSSSSSSASHTPAASSPRNLVLPLNRRRTSLARAKNTKAFACLLSFFSLPSQDPTATPGQFPIIASRDLWEFFVLLQEMEKYSVPRQVTVKSREKGWETFRLKIPFLAYSPSQGVSTDFLSWWSPRELPDWKHFEPLGHAPIVKERGGMSFEFLHQKKLCGRPCRLRGGEVVSIPLLIWQHPLSVHFAKHQAEMLPLGYFRTLPEDRMGVFVFQKFALALTNRVAFIQAFPSQVEERIVRADRFMAEIVDWVSVFRDRGALWTPLRLHEPLKRKWREEKTLRAWSMADGSSLIVIPDVMAIRLTHGEMPGVVASVPLTRSQLLEVTSLFVIIADGGSGGAFEKGKRQGEKEGRLGGGFSLNTRFPGIAKSCSDARTLRKGYEYFCESSAEPFSVLDFQDPSDPVTHSPIMSPQQSNAASCTCEMEGGSGGRFPRILIAVSGEESKAFRDLSRVMTEYGIEKGWLEEGEGEGGVGAESNGGVPAGGLGKSGPSPSLQQQQQQQQQQPVSPFQQSTSFSSSRTPPPNGSGWGGGQGRAVRLPLPPPPPLAVETLRVVCAQQFSDDGSYFLSIEAEVFHRPVILFVRIAPTAVLQPQRVGGEGGGKEATNGQGKGEREKTDGAWGSFVTAPRQRSEDLQDEKKKQEEKEKETDGYLSRADLKNMTFAHRIWVPPKGVDGISVLGLFPSAQRRLYFSSLAVQPSPLPSVPSLLNGRGSLSDSSNRVGADGKKGFAPFDLLEVDFDSHNGEGEGDGDGEGVSVAADLSARAGTPRSEALEAFARLVPPSGPHSDPRQSHSPLRDLMTPHTRWVFDCLSERMTMNLSPLPVLPKRVVHTLRPLLPERDVQETTRDPSEAFGIGGGSAAQSEAGRDRDGWTTAGMVSPARGVVSTETDIVGGVEQQLETDAEVDREAGEWELVEELSSHFFSHVQNDRETGNRGAAPPRVPSAGSSRAQGRGAATSRPGGVSSTLSSFCRGIGGGEDGEGGKETAAFRDVQRDALEMASSSDPPLGVAMASHPFFQRPPASPPPEAEGASADRGVEEEGREVEVRGDGGGGSAETVGGEGGSGMGEGGGHGDDLD